MFRYRKAFLAIFRTLLLMLLFYMLMEYGLDLLDQVWILHLDSRWKAFGLLLGFNIILACSLPGAIEQFKQILAESRQGSQ
ncbi:hypothetical protein HZU75_13025 [Chitinibacter fontanus]|uniref:Uncharacterized protein n=1 Tax=Chitinibacter fontanus TaxID=1737446 RepID=A0A7D5VBC8_9NEIS|nr:hypothetical protein [Chitinibacter fontanus]QLI82372.1 hypothetical protein HZU75_13025 [Chitinibacter fontanus]